MVDGLTMNSNNVLQNHLVLDKIFSNLGLSDIKTCRRVCSNWNAVSEKYFVQLSVCCFVNEQFRREEDPKPRDLRLFQKEFRHLSLLPFTKVCFHGCFASRDLTKYFRNRQFINDLKLFDFSVSGYKGKMLSKFDISKWTGLNLTTLDVTGALFDEEDDQAIVIPLSFLGTIQNIHLNSVTVVYNARIAPTTLKMFQNLSVSDGKRLHIYEALQLDDYVDTANLKELSIGSQISSFRFDLTEYLRLEKLDVENEVELTGWHNNLTLKTVEACQNPLNFARLPPSVQELKLYESTGNDNFTPGQIFPHLKSLECSVDFPLLSQCPNLVRVVATDDLNLNLLPATVKTLEIDPCYKLTGDAIFQLEKLLLIAHLDSSNDFWEVMQIAIDRLNPQTVVLGIPKSDMLDHGKRYQRIRLDELYARQIEFIVRQVNRLGTFVLKGLKYSNNATTETSVLSIIKAGPTLWVNGIGKNIDQKQFDKWVESY